MADFTLTFTLRTNPFLSGKTCSILPKDQEFQVFSAATNLRLRDYGGDTAIFGDFEAMEGIHEPIFSKKYQKENEFAAICAGKEGVSSGKHLVASWYLISAIEDDLALKALNLLSLQRLR